MCFARFGRSRMILAIDQGTTGTTCLLFDEQARLRGRAYREFTQHFPQPGWVEHDASEIWDVTRVVAHEALVAAGVGAGAVSAVGITNQRETVVAWDERTGEPLHNAIVWQDRRTAARCDELRAEGLEDLVRRAHRPRDRPLLLGHQDRVDARARRGLARTGGRAVTCASARSMHGWHSSSPGGR